MKDYTKKSNRLNDGLGQFIQNQSAVFVKSHRKLLFFYGLYGAVGLFMFVMGIYPMVGIGITEIDGATLALLIMFVLLPSSIPGLLLAVFCFKAWRKALSHSIAVTPDKLSINDFKSYSIPWSEITALSIDEINYFRAGRQIYLKIHVLSLIHI